MNMLGAKIAIDGLNRAFRSSGRGGGSYGLTEITDEEYFLADCLDIIREVAKMPEMEDSIVAVSTKKKRTLKQKIKGEPKEVNHELYIAQINPKGVKFPGIETHTGLSPVIGMIDDDKMFVYSTSPSKLEIYVVEEYAYDHMGDYHYRTGNVAKDGLSKDCREVRVKTYAVKSAHDIRFDGSFTVYADQKNFSARDNWVKVADLVGKQRRAYLAKTKEPTDQEMGE